MLIISIVAAVAAGACFALGAVLQQRKAATRPESEVLSPKILIDLGQRPVWLAGIAATAGSFFFKAIALAFGPLTVVQPLIATEMLFAVPASVRRHNLRLGLREWGGLAAIAGGLAIGIFSASPHGGDPLPPLPSWGMALGSLVVLAVVAVLIGRKITGPARASMFALAAVAFLVGQSVLLAATTALFKKGILVAFTAWQPYAMAVAAILALMIVQSAYQAGPLPASMPVMNTANPLIAIAIGVALFNENIATGAWHLAGAVLGLAMLIAGILVLDTSRLVQRAQRAEKEEQVDTGPSGEKPDDG